MQDFPNRHPRIPVFRVVPVTLDQVPTGNPNSPLVLKPVQKHSLEFVGLPTPSFVAPAGDGHGTLRCNDFLYVDDSIEMVKKKIAMQLKLFTRQSETLPAPPEDWVNLARQVDSIQKMYLYVIKRDRVRVGELYRELTRHGLRVTHLRLSQFVANIVRAVDDPNVTGMSLLSNLRKAVYSFHDLEQMLGGREFFLFQPLGQASCVAAKEFPFPCIPFLVYPFGAQIYDRAMEQQQPVRRSLMFLDESLLMNTGAIENNTIYMGTADAVQDFIRQRYGAWCAEKATQMYFPYTTRDPKPFAVRSRFLSYLNCSWNQHTATEVAGTTVPQVTRVAVMLSPLRAAVKIPVDALFQRVHASRRWPFVKLVTEGEHDATPIRLAADGDDGAENGRRPRLPLATVRALNRRAYLENRRIHASAAATAAATPEIPRGICVFLLLGGRGSIGSRGEEAEGVGGFEETKDRGGDDDEEEKEEEKEEGSAADGEDEMGATREKDDDEVGLHSVVAKSFSAVTVYDDGRVALVARFPSAVALGQCEERIMRELNPVIQGISDALNVSEFRFPEFLGWKDATVTETLFDVVYDFPAVPALPRQLSACAKYMFVRDQNRNESRHRKTDSMATFRFKACSGYDANRAVREFKRVFHRELQQADVTQMVHDAFPDVVAMNSQKRMRNMVADKLPLNGTGQIGFVTEVTLHRDGVGGAKIAVKQVDHIGHFVYLPHYLNELLFGSGAEPNWGYEQGEEAEGDDKLGQRELNRGQRKEEAREQRRRERVEAKGVRPQQRRGHFDDESVAEAAALAAEAIGDAVGGAKRAWPVKPLAEWYAALTRNVEPDATSWTPNDTRGWIAPAGLKEKMFWMLLLGRFPEVSVNLTCLLRIPSSPSPSTRREWFCKYMAESLMKSPLLNQTKMKNKELQTYLAQSFLRAGTLLDESSAAETPTPRTLFRIRDGILQPSLLADLSADQLQQCLVGDSRIPEGISLGRQRRVDARVFDMLPLMRETYVDLTLLRSGGLEKMWRSHPQLPADLQCIRKFRDRHVRERLVTRLMELLNIDADPATVRRELEARSRPDGRRFEREPERHDLYVVDGKWCTMSFLAWMSDEDWDEVRGNEVVEIDDEEDATEGMPPPPPAAKSVVRSEVLPVTDRDDENRYVSVLVGADLNDPNAGNDAVEGDAPEKKDDEGDEKKDDEGDEKKDDEGDEEKKVENAANDRGAEAAAMEATTDAAVAATTDARDETGAAAEAPAEAEGTTKDAEFTAPLGSCVFSTQDIRYIVSSTKRLRCGQWGFLPLTVSRFLQLPAFPADGLMKPGRSCILRHGTDDNQTFLAALCDALFFRSQCARAIAASSITFSVPSVDELKSRILASVDLDEFVQLQNGKLVDAFARPAATAYANDPEAQHAAANHPASALARILMRSNNKADRLFLCRADDAFSRFRDFVRDPAANVDHTYLWDIVCRPNPALFPRGINLVLLESRSGDPSVRIVCPTNHFSDVRFDPRKPCVLLLRRNEHVFEPLYAYASPARQQRTKPGPLDVGRLQNLFFVHDRGSSAAEATSEHARLVQDMIRNVVVNVFEQRCQPRHLVANRDASEKPMPLPQLYKALLRDGYRFRLFVRDTNQKIVGVVVQEPAVEAVTVAAEANNPREPITCMVPCLPHVLVSGTDADGPVFDTGADPRPLSPPPSQDSPESRGAWWENHYVDMDHPATKTTIENTVQFYETLAAAVDRGGEPTYVYKLAFCLVETDHIRGFLTNTGSILVVSDPRPIQADETQVLSIPVLRNQGYIVPFRYQTGKEKNMTVDTYLSQRTAPDPVRTGETHFLRRNAEYYLAFCATVRAAFHFPNRAQSLEMLAEIVNPHRPGSYAQKIQALRPLLEEVAQTKVEFTGDTNYDKRVQRVVSCVVAPNMREDIYIDRGGTCRMNEETGQTMLVLPAELKLESGAASGVERKEFYLTKLADELLRLDRVRRLFLSTSMWVQTEEGRFEVNSDEIIVRADHLNDDDMMRRIFSGRVFHTPAADDLAHGGSVDRDTVAENGEEDESNRQGGWRVQIQTTVSK